jgi:hypothetical protein
MSATVDANLGANDKLVWFVPFSPSLFDYTSSSALEGAEGVSMAKGQKHRNREAKKPKMVKVAPPPATASLLTKGSTSATDKKRG